MINTKQLGLPLIMPAQAQKHVTVNEASSKLDSFTMLRLASFTMNEPPIAPEQGESYYLSRGANGAWAGHDGQIATFVNGGWIYTQPLIGWRAWDEGGETYRVYNGYEWLDCALTVKSSGSGAMFSTEEFIHEVTPGSKGATKYLIPPHSIVFGVTGRVASAFKGSGLTSWRLGVSNADDRYGSRLGIAFNSHILGITGVPMAYFEAAPLVLTSEGGDFSSGTVNFAIHFVHLSVPRPI